MFNIGQTVRVKKEQDLLWDSDFKDAHISGIFVASNMLQRCGATAVISERTTYHNSPAYHIEEDDHRFWWPHAMLENVGPPPPEPFELGCFVASDDFELAILSGSDGDAICTIIMSTQDRGKEVRVKWENLRIIYKEEIGSIDTIN